MLVKSGSLSFWGWNLWDPADFGYLPQTEWKRWTFKMNFNPSPKTNKRWEMNACLPDDYELS